MAEGGTNAQNDAVSKAELDAVKGRVDALENKTDQDISTEYYGYTIDQNTDALSFEMTLGSNSKFIVSNLSTPYSDRYTYTHSTAFPYSLREGIYYDASSKSIKRCIQRLVEQPPMSRDTSLSGFYYGNDVNYDETNPIHKALQDRLVGSYIYNYDGLKVGGTYVTYRIKTHSITAYVKLTLTTNSDGISSINKLKFYGPNSNSSYDFSNDTVSFELVSRKIVLSSKPTYSTIPTSYMGIGGDRFIAQSNEEYFSDNDFTRDNIEIMYIYGSYATGWIPISHYYRTISSTEGTSPSYCNMGSMYCDNTNVWLSIDSYTGTANYGGVSLSLKTQLSTLNNGNGYFIRY